jgi:hypothetical protein
MSKDENEAAYLQGRRGQDRDVKVLTRVRGKF